MTKKQRQLANQARRKASKSRWGFAIVRPRGPNKKKTKRRTKKR